MPADKPRVRVRALTREVASVAIGSGISAQMEPWIGELGLDPRSPPTYRQALRDNLRALQLARDTFSDGQASATFRQRLDAAIAVPWEVHPGGESDDDRKAADDLAMRLKCFDFDAACRQMLHAIWFGYAVGELMWMRDGDGVGIADIRVRAPDRFLFAGDRELLLRTRSQPLGGPLPPAKFWLVAWPGEHGDIPHGPGLAYWCYWPVWLRRNGAKFWAVALDKFGTPTPKGTYPRGDEESKQALLELMEEYAAGAGIAMPDGTTIDLLEQLPGGGGDFKEFESYWDQAIAKIVLGQSSTTEQGPWRGTAEVQKDVRDEVIASDCRLLEESFNNTVSRWLTEWNWPGAAPPRMVRDATPPEDLDKRAEREERISNMSGLRPTAKHVEEVYGGEWEPAPAPVPGAAALPPGAALAGPDDPDGIDRALADMLEGDGWERFMEPIVGPVLAAARAAAGRGDSLADFRDRIPALFARMDDVELVETLRRMGFTARLSGDAGLIDRE